MRFFPWQTAGSVSEGLLHHSGRISHAKPSGREWRAGFTLIELLVTLAIIALLATLLMAGLGRAKAKGRATFCMNNVRQLGYAMLLYASEHEQYPMMFLPRPDGVMGLMNFLSPYLGGAIPPANPRGGVPQMSTGFWRPPYHCTEKMPYMGNYHYGYNVAGAAKLSQPVRLGLDGRKEQAVVSPAAMIALADTEGLSMAEPRAVLGLGPLSMPHSRGMTTSPGGQHSSRGNVLFCDGHIETDRREPWREATDEARRKWNYDNEPHRDLWE